MVHRRSLILLLGGLAAACSSASSGAGPEGSGASSTSSEGSGAASSTSGSGAAGTSASSGVSSASGGNGGHTATCKAVAAKTVACCPSGVSSCAPGTEDDWVSYCLTYYDSCPNSFECQASTSNCDANCPTIATGGC